MFKTSVPISIKSISDTATEKDLNQYLDYFRKGKIDRVFIAGAGCRCNGMDSGKETSCQVP